MNFPERIRTIRENDRLPLPAMVVILFRLLVITGLLGVSSWFVTLETREKTFGATIIITTCLPRTRTDARHGGRHPSCSCYHLERREIQMVSFKILTVVKFVLILLEVEARS